MVCWSYNEVEFHIVSDRVEDRAWRFRSLVYILLERMFEETFRTLGIRWPYTGKNFQRRKRTSQEIAFMRFSQVRTIGI